MRSSLLAPLALVSGLAVAASHVLIWQYAPVEQTMGPIQKIFYVHLPLAWLAMLSFFVVFVASIVATDQKNSQKRPYRRRCRRIGRALRRSGADNGLPLGPVLLEHLVDLGSAVDHHPDHVVHLFGVSGGPRPGYEPAAKSAYLRSCRNRVLSGCASGFSFRPECGDPFTLRFSPPRGADFLAK